MRKNNRVCCKSNELSRVLILHFEKKINLTRIKLISMLMISLCKVQTESLCKLAAASENDAKEVSVLRRIQCFLTSYRLNRYLAVCFIYRFYLSIGYE